MTIELEVYKELSMHTQAHQYSHTVLDTSNVTLPRPGAADHFDAKGRLKKRTHFDSCVNYHGKPRLGVEGQETVMALTSTH